MALERQLEAALLQDRIHCGRLSQRHEIERREARARAHSVHPRIGFREFALLCLGFRLIQQYLGVADDMEILTTDPAVTNDAGVPL